MENFMIFALLVTIAICIWKIMQNRQNVDVRTSEPDFDSNPQDDFEVSDSLREAIEKYKKENKG